MTLGDVLALVAGVAASFAIVANLPRHFVRSPSDELVSVAIRFLQRMTLAVAVVVLARVAVYRRMPSVAEWLGILVGSTLLIDWPWLQVDAWTYAYRWAFPTLDPLSSIAVRWLVAGLFSVAMAIGLGLFRLGRDLYPPWLKTLILSLAGAAGHVGAAPGLRRAWCRLDLPLRRLRAGHRLDPLSRGLRACGLVADGDLVWLAGDGRPRREDRATALELGRMGGLRLFDHHRVFLHDALQGRVRGPDPGLARRAALGADLVPGHRFYESICLDSL